MDYGFDLAKVQAVVANWTELSTDLSGEDAVTIGVILSRMTYVRTRWVNGFMLHDRKVSAGLVEWDGDKVRLTDETLARVYRAVED